MLTSSRCFGRRMFCRVHRAGAFATRAVRSFILGDQVGNPQSSSGIRRSSSARWFLWRRTGPDIVGEPEPRSLCSRSFSRLRFQGQSTRDSGSTGDLRGADQIHLELRAPFGGRSDGAFARRFAALRQDERGPSFGSKRSPDVRWRSRCVACCALGSRARRARTRARQYALRPGGFSVIATANTRAISG